MHESFDVAAIGDTMRGNEAEYILNINLSLKGDSRRKRTALTFCLSESNKQSSPARFTLQTFNGTMVYIHHLLLIGNTDRLTVKRPAPPDAQQIGTRFSVYLH